MKFETRMEELVRWGVSLRKATYDLQISPDMDSMIPFFPLIGS